MTSLLFEGFGWMLGSCIALYLIFLSIYYVHYTPTWKAIVRYSPVVFVLLLAVNWLVVTDNEAITNTIKSGVRACRDGSVEELQPLIADDFLSDDGTSKADLLTAVDAIFKHIKFDYVVISDLKITPPKVLMASWTTLRSKSSSDQTSIKSEWEITMQHVGNRWQFKAFKPLKINNISYDSLRSVLHEGQGVF